jgi:hypothetical protein
LSEAEAVALTVAVAENVAAEGVEDEPEAVDSLLNTEM